MTSRWWLCVIVVIAACSGEDGLPCGPAGEACMNGGAVCSTENERCTCAVGGGIYWECEPSACPVVDVTDGAPCEIAGLRCDVGFEYAGTLCVGPELRWARCLNYHRDGPLPPSGCPTQPPTVGDTCCQGLTGTQFDTGCDYAGTIYDCVDEHWAQI